MSESIIRINERKIYDFYLQGHEYQLTYNELLQIRDTIDKIIGHKPSPIDTDTSTGNVTSTYLKQLGGNLLDTWKNVTLPTQEKVRPQSSSIPLNFKKVFEKDCDPRSAYKSKFVYYKDALDNWGFHTISEDGDTSSFIKMGRIDDITSILGEMYSKIPSDKPFVKRNLLTVGVKRVTEGRRLKACVDILEYEKKIAREKTLSTNNVALYRKIN